MTLPKSIPTRPVNDFSFLREIDFAEYRRRLPRFMGEEGYEKPTAENVATRIPRVVGFIDELVETQEILTSSLTNSVFAHGEEGVGKSALLLGLLNKTALGEVAPALLAMHQYIFNQFEFFKLSPAEQVAQFDAAMEFLSPKPLAITSPNATAPASLVRQKSSLIHIDRIDDFVAHCGPERARRLVGGSLVNALENAPVHAFITAQSRNREIIEQTSTLFNRIFKQVFIGERTPEDTLNILRQMVPRFERNHKVICGDDVLSQLVQLDVFYKGRLPGVRPNKMVEFMDQLAASVNNARYGKSMELLKLEMRQAELLAEVEEVQKSLKPSPKRLESVRKALRDVQAEIEPKLAAWTAQNGKIRKTREDLLEAEATLAPLQEALELYQAWQSKETDRKAAARQKGSEQNGQEAALVASEPSPPPPTQQDRDNRDTWSKMATKKRAELAALETALFAQPPHVTVEDVRARWSKITGTAAETTSTAKAASLLNLETDVGQHVFGQAPAKKAFANIIRTLESGMSNPNLPAGVYFATGDTGCGKTEMIEWFSRISGIPLITYNMNDFQTAASATRIMGADPGNVGFGEVVTMAEEVGNKKCILLLDEFDKAHEVIQLLLMQAMDKGVMMDKFSRPVSLKDVIFALCTNVLGEGDFAPGERSDDKIVRQKLTEKINPKTGRPYFIPAIIGRLDTAQVLDRMTPQIANQVLRKEVREINQGAASKGYMVTMNDPVADAIIQDYFDASQGGRSLRQLSKMVLRPLVTNRVLTLQRAEKPDENVDEELKPMLLDIKDRRISLDGFTLDDAAIPGAEIVAGRPGGGPASAFRGAASSMA